MEEEENQNPKNRGRSENRSQKNPKWRTEKLEAFFFKKKQNLKVEEEENQK